MDQAGYSYVSAAAVKLGPDIVEVQGDGTLIVNGNATFIDTDDADLEVASGTFAVTKTLNENNEEEHHVVVGTPIYRLI